LQRYGGVWDCARYGLPMNTGYRLLYRLGITPWDRQPIPPELIALVQGARALPPGKALDLGCGTGQHSVYLASLGWIITAVDYVPRAIAAARDRARAANVEAHFEEGDVTRLEALGLDTGYTLFLDAGCFHGLPTSGREAYARGVTSLRGPDAVILLLAFEPGWRGPAPRGASAEEIASAFGPAWRMASSSAAIGMRLPGPLRNANPTWHLLRSASGA
jgi:SAM-dependent methyltransferase